MSSGKQAVWTGLDIPCLKPCWIVGYNMLYGSFVFKRGDNTLRRFQFGLFLFSISFYHLMQLFHGEVPRRFLLWELYIITATEFRCALIFAGTFVVVLSLTPLQGILVFPHLKLTRNHLIILYFLFILVSHSRTRNQKWEMSRGKSRWKNFHRYMIHPEYVWSTSLHWT